MVKLTVRSVGSSLGVLPIATTRAMKVNDGDTLFLVESPDGFRITPTRSALPDQCAVDAASTSNTSANS